MAERDCSVVMPCNECEYCSGYRKWLFAADYSEECMHCGSFFCAGDCEESYNAEMEDLARHVKNCKKVDEFCEICQCM
jgi:hypothetical protein